MARETVDGVRVESVRQARSASRPPDPDPAKRARATEPAAAPRQDDLRAVARGGWRRRREILAGVLRADRCGAGAVGRLDDARTHAVEVVGADPVAAGQTADLLDSAIPAMRSRRSMERR